MMTAKTNITTLEISDRLTYLAGEVQLIVLAAEGLEHGGELVARKASEIADEISAIARDVHKEPQLTAAVKRQLAIGRARRLKRAAAFEE